jgi:acyl-homoserine-lactone acylase
MIRYAAMFILLLAPTASANARAPQSERSPVAEILWDSWGVPHIYAKTDEGAFRAFGYAQMESHGNLLLRLFAEARGRGAEFYGRAYVDSDRAVKTMGTYDLAQRWLGEQSPTFRRYLNAFAAGVNQYARENPDKLDSAGKAILPITAVDILAHTTREFYSFVDALTDCSSALPPAVPLGSSGDAWANPESGKSSGNFGTNIWAIAPSHSTNGHAMLLSNDHLPWTDETLFYEAQITAPGYSVYGSTPVGWPVLSTGSFNNSHGWTLSVNTSDGCTLYTLTPEGNGYRFDGRKRSFETEHETIKVKQVDGGIKEIPLIVRHAVQGPVEEVDGELTAIRMAGIQASSYPGVLEEFWEMGRAHDLAEFQHALRRMQLPMFNVMYADSSGHIMVKYLGLVPVRPKGDWAFWSKPVSGDTSSLVWTRMLPYDDLPAVIDPPSGWVQNSNSAPWYMTEPFLNPAKYPAYISPSPATPDGWPNLREQRGLRMITQSTKLSFAQLLTDKLSTHSGLADRVLDDLISAARQSNDQNAKEAANVLQGWDRDFNSDSRGAELFFIWMLQLTRHGNVSEIFRQPFSLKHPLDTPRGLKDPRRAVQALGTAAVRLRQIAGRLDVPWGELNRLHRGMFDFPGNGATGDDLGVFRVIQYSPWKDHEFQAVGGDTFIAIVEFSNPIKAKVLLTYGNSSNPHSPYFGDQLGLTARNRWRKPWLTRAEIEKHLEHRTVFYGNGNVRHLSAGTSAGYLTGRLHGASAAHRGVD